MVALDSSFAHGTNYVIQLGLQMKVGGID